MTADFIKRLSARPVAINLRLVREFHDPQETLLFVWCVDKTEFVAAFLRLGLRIVSAKDLQRLYNIWQKGWDVRGVLKNAAGVPVRFDLMRILLSIKTTKVEIQRALDRKIIKLYWQ